MTCRPDRATTSGIVRPGAVTFWEPGRSARCVFCPTTSGRRLPSPYPKHQEETGMQDHGSIRRRRHPPGHQRRRRTRRTGRTAGGGGLSHHISGLPPAAPLARLLRAHRLGRRRGDGHLGIGLTRHLTAAGVQVVDVDRPNRQNRRRRGKFDSHRRRRRSPGGPIGRGQHHRQVPGGQRRGHPDPPHRPLERPGRPAPGDEPAAELGGHGTRRTA